MQNKRLKAAFFVLMTVIFIWQPSVFCEGAGAVAVPVIYEDPAETINKPVGGSFCISLESEPEGRYKWLFAKPLDSSILQLISYGYEVSARAAQDKKGREVFLFKTLKPGITMISLKYAREGERDMYPLGSKTFIVVVE